MTLIGKNRLEAIDWVQEQLGNSSRVRAERTFHALERDGMIVETKTDLHIARELHNGQLHTIAAAEDVNRLNNQPRARMTKRHHSPTTKRSRIVKLHQGNSIDCATDEVFS